MVNIHYTIQYIATSIAWLLADSIATVAHGDRMYYKSSDIITSGEPCQSIYSTTKQVHERCCVRWCVSNGG